MTKKKNSYRIPNITMNHTIIYYYILLQSTIEVGVIILLINHF